jgi:hypothetical protein
MNGIGANLLLPILLVQPKEAPKSDPRAARSTATDLYVTLGLLIGALLLLAIGVAVAKRWYERTKSDDEDASTFLTEARELEEEGELTKEEYLKIKAKLAAGLQTPKNTPIKGGDPAKRSNPPPRQNPPEP